MRAVMLRVLLWFCTWAPAAHALERFDFTAPLMATTFHIALHADSKMTAEAAADAAFKRIGELNAAFSDYEPNSEVMRLCNAGPNVPFKASPVLFDITSRALELARITDGAFDPTCGNLTRLWRHTKRVKRLPPADRLQQAIAATGWRGVQLDSQTQTITLTKPGMLIDLGGIAKGYAADAALRILGERGITRALVIAGGDIAIGDPPPDEDTWEVKLRTFQHSASDGTEPLETRRLKNCGVSTSGDLYQFVEIDGVRYSHIVSPKTGLGLTERIACTVIAPDCTTSDALATAMCVLGKERGEATATKLRGVTVKFAPP